MKKILTIAAVLLSSMVAMAQSLTTLPLPQGALMSGNDLTLSAPAHAGIRSHIQLKENQNILGYYKSETLPTDGSGLPKYPGKFVVYTMIPATHCDLLTNAKIDGVRFGLASAIGATTVEVRPWYYDTGVANPIATASVTTTQVGWNMVEFDTPVSIPSGVAGLLVGFSYTQKNTLSGGEYTEECYPLCLNNADNPNGAIVYGNIQGAVNYYNMGGTLCIQAIVESDPVASQVIPMSNTWTLAKKGTASSTYLSFVAASQESIRTLAYTLTIDGKNEEHTATLSPVLSAGVGVDGTIRVPLPATDVAGGHNVTIHIDKINSTPVNTRSYTFPMCVIDRTGEHVALVEEFTGTGCIWCTRGWAGMETLKEKMPEKVAIVAIHQYDNKDPMYCTSYNTPNFPGAPSAMVDRSGEVVDPFEGNKKKAEGIVTYVNDCLKSPATVNINLTANLSADLKKVEVNAATEFLTDLKGSSIAFVLTGDGLTGTTTLWAQANSYASYTAAQWDVTGTKLADFCKGGQYGKSSVILTYNDVLLASSWSSQGVNAAPAFSTTAIGQTAQTAYTLVLPTKTSLKNALKYDELYAIAIVFNPDGTVGNAARCRVTPPAGIDDITLDAAQTPATFDLQGRAVKAGARGLLIQGGRKVLVK